MAGLLALCAEAGGGPLFGVLAALAAMAGATLLDDDQGQV
jgi:hypothetical protein